jgi:hypothetical protein
VIHRLGRYSGRVRLVALAAELAAAEQAVWAAAQAMMANRGPATLDVWTRAVAYVSIDSLYIGVMYCALVNWKTLLLYVLTMVL